MVKYEIARWLTPGLTPIRLVFTTYGGSAHGVVSMETQDIETGEWAEIEQWGEANGIPETKGEQVDQSTINQFTGETDYDQQQAERWGTKAEKLASRFVECGVDLKEIADAVEEAREGDDG